MADGVVQSVVQLLTQLISAEVTLRTGLPDELKAIKDEFKKMSAFLKVADKRAEENDSVKQWVNEVRVLAYDIEDVIEGYQLLHKEGTLGSVKHTLFLRKRTIAKKIRDLRQRAAVVLSDSPYKLDINVVEQASPDAQVARSSPVIQECELVGAQTPKGQIIELLSLQELDFRRETIAVLGMRGLGKTTVVGCVYNDASVKEYFPIRAWIVVSQTRSFPDMLISMIKQFYEAAREMADTQRACSSSSSQKYCFYPKNLDDINSMGEISLQNLLKRYLEEKRYMIVFDDVVEDIELADFVKFVLPDNNNGSKILMTTRYENMARAWLEGSSHGPYKLKPQTSDNAWILFCKKTFQNGGGRCPTNLHDVARGLVGRCEGLPLAILLIARLLYGKQNDLHQWEMVHGNIGFFLEQNQHLIKIPKILIRDYHDLKHYLKPCFLYFGLFPKSYALHRMRLIRLWIAEGFVRERGDLTLEEVAEEYLNQLINMCLVLVVCTDVAGKPTSLRVHDFVHETILYKLAELSFCQVISKNHSSLVENPRRLSIHKDHGANADKILKSIDRNDISNIRSLYLIEQVPEIFSKVISKEFFKKVYLLKVLDLCDAPIDIIPDEVGRLLNLRYLSLRNTRVRKLPSSIGKLQDLQTLDLKQTHIYELPTEIHRLHKLRHLLARFYKYNPDFSYHIMEVEGIKMPTGALRNFQDLQKLAFLDVGHADGFMKELVHLTQLRKLGIVNLSKLVDGKDLSDAIEGMRHLQALSVFTTYKNDTIDILECMRSLPPTLKCLYLSGCLRSLPDCMLQLQSLLKVRLRWSHMEHNPLKILEKLPNLLELQLLEAYDGDKIEIGNVGFQKLKVLHLLDLRKLRSLFINKLAMPLLEELSVGESLSMSMPTGIQYLSKLQTLSFYGMPESFCRSIQSGGQYNSIVKHVPDVFFNHKSGDKWQNDKL